MDWGLIVLGEYDEVDAGTLHTSFRRPSPAFSLQNLRYALAAADYGSFRRAAEALLLRQSTLVIAHPRGWLVQAGRGIGFAWRVRRMASMARIERRRAVSTTERMSA